MLQGPTLLSIIMAAPWLTQHGVEEVIVFAWPLSALVCMCVLLCFLAFNALLHCCSQKVKQGETV